MSGPMGLLLGLLLVSYLGGMRSRAHGLWRLGSPSAAEYVLLGAVLGPLLMGVIQRSWIVTFEPILVAGASWLALVAGVGYGRSTAKHQGRLSVLGALLTGSIALGVVLVVWMSLALWPTLASADRWVLAMGSGVVASATTHQGVRWVVERENCSGPVSAGLVGVTRFSPLVPALMLAVVCATVPGHGLLTLGAPARIAATLGIGVGLGTIAALLLGREFRKNESWGIVLGTALLGSGICVRLGLSAVAALFSCGMSMTLASPHRGEIRALLVPTDRAVLLPVALLAGASLSAEPLPLYGGLIAIALGVRLLLELVRGKILSRVLGDPQKPALSIGLSLLSTGGFTLAAALELDWRVGAPWGALFLFLAAAGNLLGEILGPLALRRSLERIGERPVQAPTLPQGPLPAAHESTP